MPPFDATALVSSFRAAGAWIDEDIMSLAPIEGMGWGAIAKKRIEAHTPLFHIPPAYLLTPWTSSLRTHLSDAEWASLEGGWARLILCMMWEESRPDSLWGGYLANMPREFDSPMFWNDADREGLKGTDIEERIGREDAEAEYNNKLVPVISAHPDLFPQSNGCFSLEAFHVQGSRILSRSFTIPITRAGGPAPEAGNDEEEDEEEEEVAVMVPMADMLNAAYERDNARLYADGDEDEEADSDEDEDMGAAEEKRKALAAAKKFGEGYTMITTKAIEAGEQIYNTYASPPNSELLRKYGHVDALPLGPDLASLLTEEEIGGYPLGNAGDEVEVSGDLLVDAAVAAGHLKREGADGADARVDWWLDEGQADSFSITFPSSPLEMLSVVPPALWAFARLLTREEDWARAKRGKLPKPKEDDPASIAIILAAIKARAARYPQTLEADFVIVKDANVGLNLRNAAAVRIGEKRVLSLAARILQNELDILSEKQQEPDAKRKADSKGREGRGKRSKK